VRLALAAGLLILLVADGALWSRAFSSGELQAGRLLLHPEQMDGESLVLSLVDVVELRDHSYVVKSGKQRFEVVGPTAGLQLRDEVYIGGRFEASEGRVHEEWRELAPARGNKKLLGVVGLLAAALLLPFVLGAERGGLVLRG